MPGLGATEWKRGGWRMTVTADARGTDQGGFAVALMRRDGTGGRWCSEAGPYDALGFS